MYFMLCFPEHFLHMRPVQIRLVDKMLKIYRLEVDSLKERKCRFNFGSQQKRISCRLVIINYQLSVLSANLKCVSTSDN